MSRACFGSLDEGVEKVDAVGLMMVAGVVSLAEEDGDELASGGEVGAGLAGGFHAAVEFGRSGAPAVAEHAGVGFVTEPGHGGGLDVGGQGAGGDLAVEGVDVGVDGGGTVQSAMTGAPMAGAWIDVWQCDGDGTYDVDGYRLRGHQHTDDQGRYRIETVIPSDYEDHFEFAGRQFDMRRTAHIHVKVKARMRPTLTTQLYLPDHPMNEGDGIFNAACVVQYTPGSTRDAMFDFVVM